MYRTATIITNNIKVFDFFELHYDVQLLSASYVEVLYATRDLIHRGFRLLTHPLAGSLKPNQTPYKSIVLSGGGTKVDFESLKLIESCLESAVKFFRCRSTPNWDSKSLDDFQTVDLSFIQGAIGNNHEIPKRRYAS